MKKLSLLLLLAVLSVVSARADELVLDFTSNDYGIPTSQITSSVTLSNTGSVTISIEPGNGIIYYNSNRNPKALYLSKYGFSIIVQAPTNGKITKMELTGASNLLFNGTVVSGTTWEGSEEKVIITKNKNAAMPITKMVITYTPAGGGQVVAPEEVTFDPASGATVDTGSTVIVSAKGAETIAYTLGGETTSVSGESAEVTMPATPGNYTLNVTATNEAGESTGTATYTVAIPAPGDITFDPESGVIAAGATVTIASEGATSLSYTINDGEPTTVNGDNASVTMPEDHGSYTLKVTATNEGGSTEGSATYTIISESSDPFELVTKASQLKAGMRIIIGDPNNEPQTVMSIYGTNTNMNSEQATITDNKITEIPTNAQIITLVAGENGGWYLEDADYSFYFYSHGQNLTLSQNNRTEFKVEINEDGTAKLYYDYVIGSTNYGTYYITHNKYNNANNYYCFLPNQITETNHRYYPCIYAQGIEEEPVTPAEEVLYKTLESTGATCNWIFEEMGPWMWQTDKVTGEGHLWAMYSEGIAYDPTEYALPSGNIIITATFKQNQTIEDAKFLIRKVGTEEWTELPITSTASRADNYGKATLTSYKGENVQIGLKYPGNGSPNWEVSNLNISSRVRTAIDEVTVEDANAPVVFYNLQGMRVNAENLTPGIYVRVQGRTSTKVLVK